MGTDVICRVKRFSSFLEASQVKSVVHFLLHRDTPIWKVVYVLTLVLSHDNSSGQKATEMTSVSKIILCSQTQVGVPWVYIILSVPTGNWFLDPQSYPKSTDTQVLT